MKNLTHNRKQQPTKPISRLLLTFAVTFATLFIITTATRAAGLLIADGGFGGVLEIKEHNVRVTINNNIAVTEVEQIFLNTEQRIVEALYTFPVPKNASVANFSMWINGKEMIGEVVEKNAPREIYESYKQTRRDPGLLEQVDYKTFEMRIFPIPANVEQRVKVTYYQELDVDHDFATYVYPLATVTRSNIDQRTTSRMSLAIDVQNEIPIIEMNSNSHQNDFVIANHGKHYYQASLETQAGDLSRDVVLSYHLSRPKTGIDVITSKQNREDGYFALTLTAGQELARLDIPMDYVFILDISGSMARDGKLQLSTDSVDAFIKSLSPNDRFEVITFNVQPNTLFNQLNPADEQSQTTATRFLATQQARGGTSLKPAVQTAYRYQDPDRPLNVIVLSDGMTEQNERAALLQLISTRPANARVFCIGVGNEVNRPLLRQIAEDAGGLAAFISQGDDFNRQAKAFRRKLTRPAASNVRISFDGGDIYDVEPQQLPDLYHGAPVRMYGRYKKAGQTQITLSADVMGRPITQTLAIDLPKADDNNPEIERMWAWHRVQNLLRQADRQGNRQPVIDQIVQLGEGYSIVTEYTSFIVLENDSEYRRWKIDRKNALRIERDRASRQRLQAELQTLRERATAQLGPQKTDPDAAGNNELAMANATSPQPQLRQQASQPQNTRPRSHDIDFGGGGGGALDPISGAIILTLGGSVLMNRRRHQDAKETK